MADEVQVNHKLPIDDDEGVELFGMTLEQMTNYLRSLPMEQQQSFAKLAPIKTSAVLIGARYEPTPDSELVDAVTGDGDNQ